MNIRNGFNFMYWLINDTDTLFTNEISIILTDSTTIQAVFEDIIEPVEAFVVINEIMYKPSSNMDSGDWIELHNPGDFKIDISSYVLKDDNNERDFAIPNGTFLESKEYLVLSGNLKDFRKVYPDVNNYLGEFDYGFGTDDMVRLYDKSRNIVDSVSYMNKAPWYPQADGGGPSLELISAFLDNSLAQNWKVSSNNGGSPGKPNSVTSVNSSEFFSQIKIYPNPAVSYTNIEFELEFDSYIVVNISDIFGNEIVKLLDGNYQKGKYLTYWNGKNFENTDMQSGIYFINIKTEQNTIRGKLILN
jgi:hypothetical protein